MSTKNLIPRIELILPKKIVGMKVKMSIANDRTFQLWQAFMPIRKSIANPICNDLICMQRYFNLTDFSGFTLETEFEKWAAIEVSDFSNIPSDMIGYEMRGGLYAVFNYVGLPSDFQETFKYIHFEWLPKSEYLLDDREHFDLLGEKYKNNDPASEEEIWIPIIKRT